MSNAGEKFVRAQPTFIFKSGPEGCRKSLVTLYIVHMIRSHVHSIFQEPATLQK